MSTAAAAFDRVLEAAEKIRNDAHQVAGAMSVGDVIRQGDIYFECIERITGYQIPVKLQLAPGTTQGSRHIIDDPTGVEMFSSDPANPLEGPQIRCDRPVRITHPEHGDWTLQPGSYRIRYQRAFSDELRRVMD